MPYSSGELTTEDKINLASLPKHHFGTFSNTTNNIGLDANNPNYFLGFILASSSEGFELNSAIDGSIRNVSGHTLTAVGTISFQPFKSEGVTATLELWSERSLDNGSTWIINDNSLRSIEISNNGESFKTVLSLVLDWEDDALIRFRSFVSVGSIVNLIAPTIVSDGVTITGPSIVWELAER